MCQTLKQRSFSFRYSTPSVSKQSSERLLPLFPLFIDARRAHFDTVVELEFGWCLTRAPDDKGRDIGRPWMGQTWSKTSSTRQIEMYLIHSSLLSISEFYCCTLGGSDTNVSDTSEGESFYWSTNFSFNRKDETR